MCGIFISVHQALPNKQCSCSINNIPDHIKYFLKNRGPDDYKERIILTTNKCVSIISSAAILHQRGLKNKVISQPLIDKDLNMLLWNGELFGGIPVAFESNDTETLLKILSNLENESDILTCLGKINGPWAFCFWSQRTNKLWFGRDILGRRSLVWKLNNDNNCQVLQISSITDGQKGWEEIPASGIFCLDITNEKLSPKCFKWTLKPSGRHIFNSASENSTQVQIPIKSGFNTKHCDTRQAESVFHYVSKLYSLEPSSTLEKLLLNFKDMSTNDSISVLKELAGSKFFQSYIDNFISILRIAVERRVGNQPLLCKDCFKDSKIQKCSHASLGILFSGGVDCIVLAALADECFQKDLPIDLLNVSFQHSKSVKNPNSSKKQSTCNESELSFESPDRITGIEGYKELIQICPERKWNFIEINITIEELKQARQNRIKYLIHPSETVLDDSIGCATWFASKGHGNLFTFSGDKIPYTSPARVVLLGMGADEQFGGYSRHRQKYTMGGWAALMNEIILEIDRISIRNLCRDDRIVSDHGREARFPYLDENVVSFLNSVPIYVKLNLELPRGLGEKLLLRLVAFTLKIKNAAVLPKRAIQFGSRIAKSESKEKGADVCKRLN